MFSYLVPPVLIQRRFRETVSFFNRYPAEHLWKSATHVSSVGRKKGRHKYRRRIINLNQGQIIGKGRIRTFFPGLHSDRYHSARDVLRDVEVLPPLGPLDYIPAPGFLPRPERRYNPDTEQARDPAHAGPVVAVPGARRRKMMKGLRAGEGYVQKLREIGATIPGRSYNPPPVFSRKDFHENFDFRKPPSHLVEGTVKKGPSSSSGTKLDGESSGPVKTGTRSLHTHVSDLLLPRFSSLSLAACRLYSSGDPKNTDGDVRKVPLEFEREEQEEGDDESTSEFNESKTDQNYFYEEPPYMLDQERRSKWSLHPMVRGWAGIRPPGRRFGPPDAMDEDEDMSEFDSICLESKAVAHMDGRIGRSRAWWSLMVVGNGKGLVGFAKARMPSGMASIRTAKNKAAKRLVFIERLDDRTIFQDFWAEFGHTRIFARRAMEGNGLVCHRVIKAICELAGIKDLYARVEGSTRNYYAFCHAFFYALTRQETYQQLADRKKLHVVEFSEKDGYYPVVRASPRSGHVRTLAELEPNEPRMLDEVFGEGRYPLGNKYPPPFYKKLESYKIAQERDHRWRNHEAMRIRLQADGVIPDFSEQGRKVFAEREEQRVIDGETTIPYGIGLPSITRYMKEERGEGE